MVRVAPEIACRIFEASINLEIISQLSGIEKFMGSFNTWE